MRFGGTDHGYGQLIALDHDFRTGAHTSQQSSEIAGGLRLRDVDHMVSHVVIISCWSTRGAVTFQQAEQHFLLQAAPQNLLHIAAALEDGDYMQRLRVGPVDNKIGIGWEELHCFVREILAPVTDAWALASETIWSRIVASTRSAIFALLSFLM
jgi:hypothetical protein